MYGNASVGRIPWLLSLLACTTWGLQGEQIAAVKKVGLPGIVMHTWEIPTQGKWPQKDSADFEPVPGYIINSRKSLYFLKSQPSLPPKPRLCAQTIGCHFQICLLLILSLRLGFLGLVLSILWAYILCFRKSWRSRGGEGMLIMHLPANLKNFLCEYMRVFGLTLVTTSTLLMLLCLESRWETQTTQHLLGPVSHASL